MFRAVLQKHFLDKLLEISKKISVLKPATLLKIGLYSIHVFHDIF